MHKQHIFVLDTVGKHLDTVKIKSQGIQTAWSVSEHRLILLCQCSARQSAINAFLLFPISQWHELSSRASRSEALPQHQFSWVAALASLELHLRGSSCALPYNVPHKCTYHCGRNLFESELFKYITDYRADN